MCMNEYEFFFFSFSPFDHKHRKQCNQQLLSRRTKEKCTRIKVFKSFSYFVGFVVFFVCVLRLFYFSSTSHLPFLRSVALLLVFVYFASEVAAVVTVERQKQQKITKNTSVFRIYMLCICATGKSIEVHRKPI